jgi:hypothetical protein
MAVIAHVILRGVTPGQYDAARAKAGWLEQAPDGGIAHLTWWDGADCHNVDAWDSEAAFTTFGEQRLGPAMAAVGVNVQPEATFYPAHEVYLPHAATWAGLREPMNVQLVLTGPGGGTWDIAVGEARPARPLSQSSPMRSVRPATGPVPRRA